MKSTWRIDFGRRGEESKLKEAEIEIMTLQEWAIKAHYGEGQLTKTKMLSMPLVRFEDHNKELERIQAECNRCYETFRNNKTKLEQRLERIRQLIIGFPMNALTNSSLSPNDKFTIIQKWLECLKKGTETK